MDNLGVIEAGLTPFLNGRRGLKNGGVRTRTGSAKREGRSA